MSITGWRGAVEHISRIGLRGWIDIPGSAGPAKVTILVDGVEEARILARLPRDDVRQAGLSEDGLCGFEFIWQAPLPREMLDRVRVLAEPDGEELPRAQKGGPILLYERIFAGFRTVDTTVPESAFLSANYTRHNARRLEHLASLRLPLHGRSVVEFGAGVGDHTSFYLDRGCEVLATDARAANLALLEARLRDHPRRAALQTAQLNVEAAFDLGRRFDIVHCYGLLYHLADPAAALACMAKHSASLLLLETKTSPGNDESVIAGRENAAETYHSFSGSNARPTRAWILRELKRHFPHVLFPTTAPAHEEFPTNWSDLSAVPDGWPRTVVVASRESLDHTGLAHVIPLRLDPS